MTSPEIPWLIWTFPVAFTIHNIEEAIWLPAFSGKAGRFHRPVGRFEFVFALVPITLLGWAVTWALWRFGRQSLGSYLFFAFVFGMSVNVIYPHLVATVALRRYCPGLATGLIFLLPTTTSLLVWGYAGGFYSLPKLCVITPVFAAIVIGSIPLLFRLGRWTKLQIGRNPS